MKKKTILTLISCFCICGLLSTELSVMAAGMDENLKSDSLATEKTSGILEYSMEGVEIRSMDEEGNVFVVENQGDGVVQEGKARAASSSTKIVNFRADSSGNSVTSTTEYEEYGTGAIGYTYGGSGADAAYLGTENGKVKFMLSGVIGLVDSSKVQVVSMSNVKSYSCYYADGENLIHRIAMDMTTSGWGGSINVGPQQSYMTSDTTYYSYDGHYFYTDYEMMLTDYKNDTRKNSINPSQPYYNYFQFLPFRGKSNYSESEMKSMVNTKASSESKMYNTGDVFVKNQNTYGTNALLMIGIAANESGWGTSSIAKEKNNIFGINAVDSSPGSSANAFSDVNTCIKDFSETYLSKRYLRPGYDYYNGGYVGDKASGINVRYASDPYWGEKAAAIAWSLDGNSGKKDQYNYTIGIKDTVANGHKELNVRNEANTSCTVLYTTGTVSNYAFLILGESGSFYKVQSDPVLSSGRTGINKDSGTYDSSSMYAYASKEYISIVSNGMSSSPSEEKKVGISYCTHVQGSGWQDYVSDGTTSGTTGSEKRLEAIKVKLDNPEYTGSVQYRAHVQTYGWLDWVKDDEQCGTTGESKRMEAVQIQLTGEVAEYYDIYYRAHVQTYGWLDWAKNGEIAGTTDASKRMEAIEIKLVKKGGAVPGKTTSAYVQPLVQYRTHVQTYGWQDYVMGGGYSGTTGESKRLEAIQIGLINQKYSGDIEYRVHVQSYGWMNWNIGGRVAGTTGESKRLEAIQIKLTGIMAEKYDIYYRVHSQTYGWLGWAKNGESAGTEGLAKRLESIQIVLVAKEGAAPGSTENACVTE